MPRRPQVRSPRTPPPGSSPVLFQAPLPGSRLQDLHIPSIVDGIARHGFAVQPDFLPREEVRALRIEARRSWRRGKLRRAGVGQGATVHEGIRGDHIQWLEPDDPRPCMRRYFRRLEELRTAFNRELYLGLHDFEAHLAAYPPGSFYLRHRDRLRRDELRTVSVLLYLNPRWQEEEGGALRLHGVGAGGFLDVPPRAGTLATFLSGEIEHEVRLTHRLRLSLTAWFRRRP